MASVVKMLTGSAGGAGGTGFSGPQAATIQDPVTQAQIEQGYTGSQSAMDQQNSLLGALQAQNGLANQNQVFGQLQGVANGTGPNPAQAQLAQATGANVANQAAMAAGQRGAGANVGMMQRQAAQQGAGIQQNAAGQAATMQANQSLSALNQMGNLAGQQAGQQIGQTNANTQAQQAQYQSMLNAKQGVNNANVGMQSNINQANAGLAGQGMRNQGTMLGGIMNGASAVLGAFAGGGAVPDKAHYDMGGPIMAPGGSTSRFGQFVNNASAGPGIQSVGTIGTGEDAYVPKIDKPVKKETEEPEEAPEGQMAGGAGDSVMPSNQPPIQLGTQGEMFAAQGGKVPALVSPGEQYLPPKDVKKVAKGADPLSTGERIPGKPKHPGNDYRNDTVKKTLEAGGIVIPNEVMQSKHPHWAAKKFVEAHMAKQNGLKPTLKRKK